ncbi:cation:proton antiporter [Streptomyces sp. NPDC048301]|uniref:cation:proton antiporter domain-containing protein n=1 Tax=Streptomyces sp. NPDC048301 TaxID=3155631 RepID=UPI003429889D
MVVLESLLRPAHVAAALVTALLLARAGRVAARRLRQPEVVGEVTVGLLAGPVVLALAGRERFGAILPDAVLDVLELIGQVGLVLYLTGLTHKLGPVPGGSRRRSLPILVVCAFVLPLGAGLLLAAIVSAAGDTAARGSAPAPAFALMVAVAMSITAVPVLSRILGDRGLGNSAEGRLALSAAIAMDGLGWVLLVLAIGLGAGDYSGLVGASTALVVGGACAGTLRLVLRTSHAGRVRERMPRVTAVLLGCAALGTALVTEHLGMTAVVGAAMVGLAIPAGALSPWGPTVASVAGTGRGLTPVFFVVTGVTVLTGTFSSVPWTLIALTVGLGCAGKLLGGYLGGRLAGSSPAGARRIAVLMNTRGLTELIVLEAGHRAGILPAPLVLALVVMALVTTAMTGPLLGPGADPAGAAPLRPASPQPVVTEGSTQ